MIIPTISTFLSYREKAHDMRIQSWKFKTLSWITNYDPLSRTLKILHNLVIKKVFLFNLYHVSRQSKTLSGFIEQKLNSTKYEFSFISKNESSYMLNTAIKFVTNLWKLNYTYFCHNAFKTSELIGVTLLLLLSSFTLFTTFTETTKPKNQETVSI